MGRPALDLTGHIFGRLTVLRRVNPPAWETKQVWWECRCECGNIHRVRRGHLRGGAQSCGCQLRETLSKIHTKHGLSKTKEYGAWTQFRSRCTNPNHQQFPSYGGRGLGFDPRWNDFLAFLADMGPCPPGKSLERRDNNAGYFPWNCEWADVFEQNRNRRITNWIEWDGQQLTVSEWSRKLGITRNTVKHRWQHHQSLAPRTRKYGSASDATS